MKLPVLLLTGAFALVPCAGLPAQEPSPAAAGGSRSASAASAFSEAQILDAWGWSMAQDYEVANVDLSESERAAFLKGMGDAFKGRHMPYVDDFHAVDPEIKSMASERRQKYVLGITRQHEAEAARFFAGLVKDPRVVALPCGTYYRILKPGMGPLPKPEQTVSVHYTGRLIDGTEFIQFGPLDWVLVSNHSVCRGWYESLQRIGKGGVIELYVPPPLPEKTAALMGIPPGSAMTFEVDVLDLKDTSPDALADSLLPPAPEPPPDSPSGLSGLQIIESWGFFTGRRTGIGNLGLRDDEQSLFLKGMDAAMRGRPASHALRAIGPAIDAFTHELWDKARIAYRDKTLAASAAFFADLRKKPGIFALPDGLCYEILGAGSGPYPKPGQRVKVDYVGRLLGGGEFDRTRDEPATLPLGSSVLGSGWDEGVERVRKGGAIRLYIPPSLAYGDEAITGVPADSTLIFDLKLLDIKDAPPDDSKSGPAEGK